LKSARAKFGSNNLSEKQTKNKRTRGHGLSGRAPDYHSPALETKKEIRVEKKNTNSGE
jgi:hypothetical protein